MKNKKKASDIPSDKKDMDYLYRVLDATKNIDKVNYHKQLEE